MTAQSADGLQVERAALVAFEAQPNAGQAGLRQAALAAGILLLLALVGVLLWRRGRSRRVSSFVSRQR